MPSSKRSIWGVTLVSVVVLAAAVGFILSGDSSGGFPGPGGPGGPPPPGAANPTPKGLPAAAPGSAGPAPTTSPGEPTQNASSVHLSVITVEATHYRAQVSGHAETQAHYTLTLAAAQAGLVKTVSPKLELGAHLQSGEVLASLENSTQRSALATAQQSLAEAKLELLQEQREAQRAREEWEASGLTGKPASALVLRGPQLAAAQATLQQANAAVEAAEAELAQTVLAAPFDAIVISRSVSPGQYLSVGAEVAELVSNDSVDIELYLDDDEWQLLPQTDELLQLQVDVASLDGNTQWQGRVTGTAQNIDTTTRQRAIRISVDQPFDQATPLLPGRFVKVSIAGKPLDGLWQLPAAARSQQGKIWYLDRNERLASFSARPLFTQGDTIFVRPPEALAAQTQRVVARPLNSYIEGMAVTLGDEPE